MFVLVYELSLPPSFAISKRQYRRVRHRSGNLRLRRRWKQRYFTKIGDDCYTLPVRWPINTNQWL